MDLITHVPGVTNSALFTPGPNTTAPWNVAHTGLTDGTSPNNASKNMAEIYNRLFLDRAAVIQKAGLTIDNNNWVQMAEAIEILIGSDPNLAEVINNTYIGPAPTLLRAFTSSVVLADMASPSAYYTLQTLSFVGARRARVQGHAAFGNTSASTCNVTLEMWLNGSNVFGSHYLGAILPPNGIAQIPITILDSLSSLNPATTYTLTLKGKKQSAVGPIPVQDTYLDVEFY